MRGRRSSSRLGLQSAASVDGTGAMPLRHPRVSASKLLAGLLVAGSIWFLVTLFVDERFRVQAVDVSGASLVRTSDVLELVDVVNASVFSVQGLKYERLLLSAFGCIERVEIECRLPNRVTIALTEHEAAAVWESTGGRWWVAPDGRVLGAAHHTEDLVIVRDGKRYAQVPGDYIVGVPWRLARDLHVALPEIKAFEFAPERGLILYVTPKEWPVYLGSEGDAPTKVALMRALVDKLVASNTDVAYIDLTNERRPTYEKR
ncbi:MAG: cell division protein FtsQ/DivIB [Anaerolineae bacterium]